MPIDAPTWRAISATHKDDVYNDINKKSKSHHKYFHYARTKSFADINEEETKLQDVKNTQPSSSSSSSIVIVDDHYSQVFGKHRPGRVRGVGTDVTSQRSAFQLMSRPPSMSRHQRRRRPGRTRPYRGLGGRRDKARVVTRLPVATRFS
ncbi:hypothetical protein Taro_017563 [Colocasia esculenta]|uniref:Uncharacterized protein n=1 Tax=Colocasia esculenta TaxID=4460 RepID=A0A843UNF7_COLES|nr:hypothetical protein [Colocasia esculenta]